MTRKRKKHQAPERRNPERPGLMAAGAGGPFASGSAPQVRKPYSRLAVCGFLLLAVIVVFGQTARHGFVNFDDRGYVYENWHVRGGLTGAATAWAITAYYAGNWHPLTWLAHMLDCQIYGLKPGGHHLTSLFLHAAAAVFLFLALERMSGALWPSAWVAAVFAIHPLRVESVAWVAERKDVLSGLFFMLTLWCYARYAERPAAWGRYLLVLISFTLGLASKPMLVTLPFVLLLLDYWPLGRMSPDRVGGARGSLRDGALREPVRNSDKRSQGFDSATMGTWCPNPPFSERFAPRTLLARLVVEKIPLFVLVAASCAVTLAAQRDAMKSLAQVAFAGRVAHAVMGYVAYLGKMLYPAGLAVFYPLPKDPPPVLELAAAASVLLAISAAAFVARRKCPYLLFGWLWYLGTLVPVIGLVQVGNQAMADRYTYLTQIGLYAAFAWGAADAAGAWKRYRWPATVVSALVMAGLIVCAWQQTRYWYDSETLWTRALACSSQNPLAYTSLGNALAGRRRVDEAIAQYRKALEIEPGHAGAHTNLGNALAGRGELDEAMAHYRKALEIEPDHVEAHNNLGNALSNHGEVEAAIAHYRMALAIKADFVEAHNNLGTALARRGDVDEAMAHFRQALEIAPDCAEIHCNLGRALARRGRLDEALAHFQKALALASAQNDRDLADAIRAEIRRHQSVTPGSNAP